VKGPNGALFFTESAANKIGEITTAGAVTEFAIPTPNSQPTAITTGANGNIYLTQAGITAAGELEIGEITTAGKITEFPLGFSVFEVGGITAGPDGNVYFTVGDNNGEQLGRIAPAGTVSFLALPGGVDPGAVTTGPDGNLWVTDPDDSQIFRVTTSDAATAFAVPGGAGGGIPAGPDGNLWFMGPSFIGRITTKGVVTEFPLPTKDSLPTAITAGSDGNLYFARSSPGSGIGRITTSGVITTIPVPSSGGIAAGPDGNIWVTEDGHIARFVLNEPVGPPVPPSTNSITSASPAVSTTPAQLAAADAAIETLASVDGQTSGDTSIGVGPGTLTGWSKRR
jgi:virginiamycin B lyase